MPEYHGSTGPDVIDQAALNLSTDTIIFAEGGDDRITFKSANADGGAGNDTLTGTDNFATAAYFDSPTGVNINLVTGRATDGFGTTDTLINIRSVAGSAFNDVMIGSSANEIFTAGSGSNTITGGGGTDIVKYYFQPSSATNISYDSGSDTFTVKKSFASDSGTDTLRDVDRIEFVGAGSDGAVYTRNSFVGDFISSPNSINFTRVAGTYVAQARVGDFNGDGIPDIVMVNEVLNGAGSVANTFMLGDGHGGFRDGAGQLFQDGVAFSLSGAGRATVADFNGDGISDVLENSFGDDEPPYPGGVSVLLLSNAQTHQLVYSPQNISLFGLSHAGAAGDVNGDGKLDYVISETGPQALREFLNDGSGHLVLAAGNAPAPKTGQQFNSYATPALIDVNGDGKLDLIAGRWDGDQSSPVSRVFLNPGDGNFSQVTPISLPASGLSNETVIDIQPIDLNGDGLPDLVLAPTTGGGTASTRPASYYQTTYLQLLVNDGGGHFHDETQARLPQPMQASNGWYLSVTVADFNHDGFSDMLATSDPSQAPSVLYLNDGHGAFTLAQQFDGAATAIDVDGDGALDIVSIATSGGSMIVSRNAIAYTAGNDNVSAAAGADTLHGGAGNDTIHGSTRPDYLRGDEGNDSIVGGSSFDDANGNMGNDTISTGAGDDYAVGGKDNDLLFGDAGNDIVWGNLGDDTCNGGDGNDQCRGGQGNDVVNGGAGDDFVSGDRGDDTVTGGTGADIFHGSQDAGIDRVLDFSLAEGDRVQLDPGTTYTLSQVGADTVISMGGANQMILVGVQLSNLTPGWIFGT